MGTSVRPGPALPPRATDTRIVLAVAALAAGLRLFHLDGQLWLDEISALLYLYRRPLLQIVTQSPGLIPDPLYDALAHLASGWLGESAFAIRLPAALFGIAGVIVFHRLALRLLSAGEALLATTLFAVSYFHIFYSQNARGYTLYLFLALAATTLLLSVLDQMRWTRALGYIGVGALTAYAHPFGIFMPAGHLLIALIISRSRRTALAGTPSAAQLAVIGGTVYLVIAVLYAPFVRQALAFSFTAGRAPAHGVGLTGIIIEIVDSIRRTLFGWPGIAGAAVAGAAGFADLLRRRWVPLALLIVPLLAAAAVVTILQVGVQPRYFLLVLPLAYLVGTHGLAFIARWIIEGWLGASRHAAAAPYALLSVAVVLAAVAPLPRYYATPKQDFLGALRTVRSLASEQDRVAAATLAGHAIRDYYDPTFPVVESVADLARYEGTGERVWVITTLERVMARGTPDLLAHLRGSYRLARVLPGTLGDGAMRIYVRERPAP